MSWPQCSWPLQAFLLGAYLLASRQALVRDRWDRVCWLSALVFSVMGALEAAQILPSAHWLLDPSGHWALAALMPAGAFLWLAFDKSSARGIHRPHWLWASAMLLAVAIPHLLSWRTGWFGRENSDSVRYFVISSEIAASGVRGYLRQWLETPINSNLTMFFVPLAWTPLHKTLGVLGLSAFAQAYAADKIVCVLSAAVILLTTAYIGSKGFRPRTGLWAPLLLASAAPLWAFYGLFYFVDIPSVACASSAASVLLWALRRQSCAGGFLAGSLWAAACACKLTNVALIFPFFCLWLSALQSPRKVLAACLAGLLVGPWAVATGLGYSPGVALHLLAAKASQAFVVLRVYRHTELTSFISSDGEPLGPGFYYRHATAIFGLPLSLLALLGTLIALLRAELAGRRVALATAAWVLGYLAFLSLFSTRDERFIFVVFPAVALLAGLALAVIEEKRGTLCVLALCAAAAALSLGTFNGALHSVWRRTDFFELTKGRGLWHL